MSCGSCNTRGSFDDNVRGSFSGDHCVTDVVRGIVRAQRRAHDAMEDTCFTSCDRSIEDLLSPFEENRRRLRFDTIPFILFCKDGCKPFIGSGIISERRGRSGRSSFKCIESPIFRAKSFVDNDENCVRLELLKPVEDDRRRDGGGGPSDLSERGDRRDRRDHCDKKSVCDFFPDRDIEDFRATGVCITVDLRCFCGISCLDPITPLRARERDRDDD